jgi:large subunit ribosomal protein L29
MKASDLREKSVEDLRELQASLAHDTFQNRLKNFTNRLDDTSAIRKTKRDVARVITLLRERELGAARAEPVAVAAEPVAAAPLPAAKTKAKKVSAKASGEGAGTKKKPSKKSEANEP